MPKLKSYDVLLQERIKQDDRSWTYQVPKLPSFRETNAANLIKTIALVPRKSEHATIRLRLSDAPSNRITWSEPLDRLLLLSTEGFRITYDAKVPNGPIQTGTGRESADYLTRLCQTGISLNGISYNFFGHSNSQLKSRSCFFLAASKQEVAEKIEALGDFSKCKTVGKKAKRIGLLFSSAEMALSLDPARCEDIDDVQRGDYVFTDGCGSISPALARQLVQRRNITFRNRRYVPSVFQIRYRGYKGVLTVDTALRGQIVVQFRESMRKFKDAKDLSLSVIDYSKPYSFGFLNDEIVLLLHSLGITTHTLRCKQDAHIRFLHSAISGDVREAFRFLCYLNRTEIAEKLLLEGIDSVTASIKSLVRQEYVKMLNKHEEQRCRILIPRSRLLYGVCDPTSKKGDPGRLREGQCFVRITNETNGEPVTLVNTEVLVTRNPCLHPGDLQKFRTVDVPEFAHLVDCIVFSTSGRRPSADLMSGGDLDGDKFFVTWDPEIVPSTLSEPAAYPAGKERIEFKPITSDSRAEYFARYNNASLGRVKNLYMRWARLKGSMSPECQELNRLFSQSVDGNQIKVPSRLEDPAEAQGDGEGFVLDVLHAASKTSIESILNRNAALEDSIVEPIELFLGRQDVPLSEFELINLTLRWCDKKGEDFASYIPYFNYRALTEEQQVWMLNHLPPTKEFPSLVRNGLLQSQLLHPAELKRFKLDDQRLHWKPVFDSATDRLGRFLPTLCQTVEGFHKKLIIWRADERLTLAMYIPQKAERSTEMPVGASVRVFALPLSKGYDSPGYRVLPTKVNYRIYCEDAMFQLYDNKRANTWVFLNRGQMNDSSFRNTARATDRRRQKQQTIDDGINFDCRSSVALDKIGKDIQTHVGRMNRSGVLAAEIYVISNRDVKSMQLLDLWLEYIDTEQVHPLFEELDVEYTIPRLRDLDLAVLPDCISRFLTTRDLSKLAEFRILDEVWTLLSTLKDYGERVLLREVYRWLLDHEPRDECGYKRSRLVAELLDFLPNAAYLTVVFLESTAWTSYKEVLQEKLDTAAILILRQLILLANDMRGFVRFPLKLILQEMKLLSIQNLSSLVELIALSIRDPENALDILLWVLQPELSRLLVERLPVVERIANSLLGIALDHIDEASEGSRLTESLRLQPDGESEGFPAAKSDIRIDSKLTGILKQGDHVRLAVSQPPENAPLAAKFVTDAIVIVAQLGTVSFRCIHGLPSYFQECGWHLARCGSFVTAKTTIDAVTKFYAEKELCCSLFAPLVGIERNNVNNRFCGVKHTSVEGLNNSQNEALKASLTQPLILLWGPPGSGKTHTIVSMLLKLLEGLPEQRILVTAPTHNAVDNILQKFVKERGIEISGAQPLRVSTEVGKVASDIRKFTCDAMVGKDLNQNQRGRNEALKRVKESRLVFTTCAGAGLGLLRSESFEVVLVDEASQITEPATLIPLVKGCQRAVLVGDHVQLRATVRKHAVTVEFDVSLFERLYNTPERPGIAKVMLDMQYRMHRDICAFSSREFYQSKLQTAVADASRPLAHCRFPWPANQARKLFVPCTSPEDIGHQSKSNRGQAELCRAVCESLTTIPPDDADAGAVTENGDPKNSKAAVAAAAAFETSQIVILTPYTRQKELLATILPQYAVSSVDGYQGKEADLVVFVTVRCNTRCDMGFLGDLRRLNVAMTRARVGVIVIGDRQTLTSVPAGGEADSSKACWQRLIDSCTTVEIAPGSAGRPK